MKFTHIKAADKLRWNLWPLDDNCCPFVAYDFSRSWRCSPNLPNIFLRGMLRCCKFKRNLQGCSTDKPITQTQTCLKMPVPQPFHLPNKTAKTNQSLLLITRVSKGSSSTHRSSRARWQIMIAPSDVTSCFRSRGEATPRIRPSQSSQKDAFFLEKLNTMIELPSLVGNSESLINHPGFHGMDMCRGLWYKQKWSWIFHAWKATWGQYFWSTFTN